MAKAPAKKKKGLDLKKMKKRLLDERADIEKLEEMTEGDRKPVELDQQTQGRLARMDAMQLHEMALEQERRREVEIQRIDAALKRMEEGEYGYCLSCGDEISPKRLDTDPAAPLCVDCASG